MEGLDTGEGLDNLPSLHKGIWLHSEPSWDKSSASRHSRLPRRLLLGMEGIIQDLRLGMGM